MSEKQTPADREQKKGILRVFELLDRDGGKFFKAGLLAFLGLIPFIAAMTAVVANGAPILLLTCIPAGMLAAPQICCAADTVMRSQRDEIGWWWWDTYKRAWKNNAKASLLPGGLFGLLIGGQLYTLYYMATLEDPGREFWWLCLAALVEVAILGYYLPMLVCMELKFGSLLRNCFVLFFCHPVKSLLASVVQLVYYALILIWFPLTSIFFLMGSVWLPMLLGYNILYPVLDQHLGLKQTYRELQKRQWGEGVEEAQSEKMTIES